MDKQASIGKSKYFQIAGCLLLAVLTLLVHSEHLLSSDEGSVTNMAWHLWNHQQLYASFKDYIPPGTAVVILEAWRLTGGPTYLGAKIVSVIFCYLSAIFLLMLVHSQTKNFFVSYFASVWWVILTTAYPIINHNSYSSFLAVVILFFIFRYMENKSTAYAAFLGLLCGFELWFLQTKGVSVVVVSGLTLYLLATKKKVIGLVIFILSFILTTYLLLAPWGTGIIFYSLFILPQKINYLGSTFYNHTAILAAIALLLTMLYTLVIKQSPKYLVLFLFQIALIISMLNNFDFWHLAINSFPFLICLSCAYLDTTIGPYQNKLIVAIFCLVTAIYVSVLTYPLYLPVPSIFRGEKAIGFPNYLYEANNIYAGPFLPGLYFELRKADYFDTFSNEVYCDNTCQTRALSTFKTVRPEYAILDFSITEKYHYYKKDSLIGSYVTANYSLCGSNSGVSIYARLKCP